MQIDISGAIDRGRQRANQSGFVEGLKSVNAMEKAKSENNATDYRQALKEFQLNLQQQQIATEKKYMADTQRLYDKLREVNKHKTEAELEANLKEEIDAALKDKDYVRASILAQLSGGPASEAAIRYMAAEQKRKAGLESNVSAIEKLKTEKEQVKSGDLTATQKLKRTREIDEQIYKLEEYDQGFDNEWGAIVTGGKIDYDPIFEQINDMVADGTLTPEEAVVLRHRNQGANSSGSKDDRETMLGIQLGLLKTQLDRGTLTPEKYGIRVKELIDAYTNPELNIERSKVPPDFSKVGGEVGDILQKFQINTAQIVHSEGEKAVHNLKEWRILDAVGIDRREHAKSGNKGKNPYKYTKEALQVYSDEKLSTERQRNEQLSAKALMNQTFRLERMVRELYAEDPSQISWISKLQLSAIKSETGQVIGLIYTNIDNWLQGKEADGTPTGLEVHPKTQALASYMRQIFFEYRQQLSGAAFSVPESQDYESVFPSFFRSIDSNLSQIKSLRDVLHDKITTAHQSNLGKTVGTWVYDKRESEYADFEVYDWNTAKGGTLPDEVKTVVKTPEDWEKAKIEGIPIVINSLVEELRKGSTLNDAQLMSDVRAAFTGYTHKEARDMVRKARELAKVPPEESESEESDPDVQNKLKRPFPPDVEIPENNAPTPTPEPEEKEDTGDETGQLDRPNGAQVAYIQGKLRQKYPDGVPRSEYGMVSDTLKSIFRNMTPEEIYSTVAMV